MSASTSAILLGIMILLIIGYVIAIYEMYKTQTYLFEPYKTSVPQDGCQPLIAVRYLTPEEKEARAKLLNNAPLRNKN
jgi:hypothetical protein